MTLGTCEGCKAAKRRPQKNPAYLYAENLAMVFVASGMKVQPAVRAAVHMIIRGDCSAFADGRSTEIDSEGLDYDASSPAGERAEPSFRYAACGSAFNAGPPVIMG